jgi:chromosome segregation protein
LTGFKSFADRTELEFVRGITAVVGPNGSGKSNISDGIRWVLGEQSARSLRGGKMEDVIFAGSDARKAVNYGEVSLTLDNSDQTLPLDFSEVTVTRRVHRSGESEYFINKKPCRLKDITELFMDTGIGREAYSIIGQGRIEEILSAKSEDRRIFFEEASGIVKYKTRKREAERKLEETEQNLLRIHDLVSELADQIGPLREQSEKAEKYKQLKEELRALEISLLVRAIGQVHGAWSEASAGLAKLQEEQLVLSTVVSRHDAELETHRQHLKRLEEELEQLNAAMLKLSEEFEKGEGMGRVLQERQKNLEANRAQLVRSLESQELRLKEKEELLADLERKSAEVSAELAECESMLRREEERLAGIVGGLESGREDRLKSEMLEVLNAMAQARNEIRYAEQQIAALMRRKERLSEERDKRSAQRSEMEARREELARAAARIGEELKELGDRYLAVANRQQERERLLSEAQQTVRKWEQRIDALVSRKDTMKEMQDDYDGYQQGVKEVLKAGKRPGGLGGVHGAVAELVNVPAELETAVETALGGSLQHIVVSGEADGRAAIAYLKQRQLGRATFLPLDVIRGRAIPESELRAIKGSEGFVGVAVDLVQFDETYRNIFASLLGNVIIARTLEQANRLAARCQYRYRVVTLEGDVVNPGGSMTGGSVFRKAASLLGRRRQIEELEREIAAANGQLSQLKEKAEQLKKALAEGARDLEQMREAGERKRIEEERLRAGTDSLVQEMRNLDDTLAVLDQDLAALEQEIRDNEARRDAGEAALNESAREEARLTEAIREAEMSRKANESIRDELQARLTELKVTAAGISQEKQSLAEQERRLRKELGEIREELARTRELLAENERESAANAAEQVRQIELLNELKLQKERCAEQIEFKRAERSEGLSRLEREENETKEQRVRLKQVEESLRETEVKVNRLDVELDNLLRKLSEEYGIGFELAKERYPVPDDVSAAERKVRELKRDISLLGDVNLGAIEEYARVSERYEFLNSQKNDLLEAKAALYQVIREMDEEMSRRFRSTFEQIRAQFVVVFARLFGGGRADLVLSEPDNPLETGIDIVAQPPGKKLQNLQLLSGGERALTAIALLFAMLRVRPVPFCVLDEVEAALDEANVARFAAYLREFSAETQFIVVTHRKGTMEEADVLYGVTMQEGGVSKLVSVRLDEEADVVTA